MFQRHIVLTGATRLAVGSFTALALLGAACGITSEVGSDTPCDQLQMGDPEAAVMILAPGPGGRFEETLDSVAREPEQLFSSEKLGLDAEVGSVILSFYDDRGKVTTFGRFNLAGVADDDVRRDNDARRQGECLAEAADIAPEVDATSPNLLRALSEADEILQATGAEKTALVIHGFGASDNDGFVPIDADLSPEQRPNVLSLLIEAELIPSISHAAQFIAPGDDTDSGVQESHIVAFVDEFLCPAMTTLRCEATSVLS